MSVPPTSPASRPAGGARRRSVGEVTPVLLVRAAHPRLAVSTALGLGLAAAISGRAPREVVLVMVTALVGQAVLGWDNDLVDEDADRADGRTAKPLVGGGLDRGTVGFAEACAVLLVIPLSMSGGVTAGLCYLSAMLVAMLGHRVLRYGAWSWLPWAVSFALYPAYLSYGGWGGGFQGAPPTVAMTLAAAALGVGVHVLVSLRGLVDDNRAGRRHLPLRLALRVGAPRLLGLTVAWCVLVLAVMAVVGSTVGLSR